MSDRRFIRSRRNILKAAAIGLPMAAVVPAVVGSTGNDAKESNFAPRTYFDKGKRLSISMWDFSWLMAHGPGGAYADLERRVAEAAERGYNTLRVDCFPSRILERESTFKKNWTAGANLPRWGEIPADYTCNVRKQVAALADHCRKYDVWLGLDSWDKAHMFRSIEPPVAKTSGALSDIDGSGAAITTIAEADEERAFTAYGEVWVKALKLMREDGVLERAVWIAPMNEVPHFGSRSLESIAALKKGARNEGETQIENAQREDAIYKSVNEWMAAPIRAEVRRDHIPISYSSLGAERYAQRLTDSYDVVDIHFMPGVPTDKDDDAAFAQAARGISGPIRFAEFEKFDLEAWSHAWDRACHKHYPRLLQRTHEYFSNALNNMVLPSGKRLTAIITECYGPLIWPDSSDVDWNWYERYNADALRIVSAMNFAGSSLSNFAEPLFTLWNDVDWHWTSNMYFQATGQMQS
jgi:Sugar-binding cellulase-like